MAISEVEARDLKVGLETLPVAIRSHIRQKAERSIRKLKAHGYDTENIMPDAGMKAIGVIKGTPEGECPMLIGGVCAVYEHRPVICRVWGYPIHNGNELACCNKTFIGKRRRFHSPQLRSLLEGVSKAEHGTRCHPKNPKLLSCLPIVIGITQATSATFLPLVRFFNLAYFFTDRTPLIAKPENKFTFQ